MSIGLEALADVVAPAVLIHAIDTSRKPTALGVPHALIGGLALERYAPDLVPLFAKTVA